VFIGSGMEVNRVFGQDVRHPPKEQPLCGRRAYDLVIDHIKALTCGGARR